MKLDLDTLKQTVGGAAAAIRVVTRLEPVGHLRDKVFPPTYAGGEYATEDRYPAIDPTDNDAPLKTVLLHSVAGQANLMEEALKSTILEGRLKAGDQQVSIPILQVSFEDTAAAEYIPDPITVLDAPHRVFDAIFRDSEEPGQNGGAATIFKDTAPGKAIGKASLANATPLYEWSPTSLLFGCWNSANDKVPGKIKGNLKFARALVSEIVGYGIAQGVRVGGKDDPTGITGQAIFRLASDDTTTDEKEAVHDENGKPFYLKRGEANVWTQDKSEAKEVEKKVKDKIERKPVFRAIGWGWTTEETTAAKNSSGKAVKWGEKGKPSELLLGQIAPTVGKNKDENNVERRRLSPDKQEELRKRGGGVTMKYAIQTTVLSLSALRRLRFPTKKENGDGIIQSPETDVAVRTVLAALGLVAITAQRERDYFLRSRCELRAVDAPPFEFVVQGREMADEDKFTLTFDGAVELLSAALAVNGIPRWKLQDDMPDLKPKANLAELIRLSHERGGAEDEEQEQTGGTNDQ